MGPETAPSAALDVVRLTQLPRVLLVEDIAATFRVRIATARRWCRAGVLPASRLGGKWVVVRDDLLRQLTVSAAAARDTGVSLRLLGEEAGT